MQGLIAERVLREEVDLQVTTMTDPGVGDRTVRVRRPLKQMPSETPPSVLPKPPEMIGEH